MRDECPTGRGRVPGTSHPTGLPAREARSLADPRLRKPRNTARFRHLSTPDEIPRNTIEASRHPGCLRPASRQRSCWTAMDSATSCGVAFIKTSGLRSGEPREPPNGHVGTQVPRREHFRPARMTYRKSRHMASPERSQTSSAMSWAWPFSLFLNRQSLEPPSVRRPTEDVVADRGDDGTDTRNERRRRCHCLSLNSTRLLRQTLIGLRPLMKAVKKPMLATST